MKHLKALCLFCISCILWSACTQDRPTSSNQKTTPKPQLITQDIFLSQIDVILKMPREYVKISPKEYYKAPTDLVEDEYEKAYREEKILQITEAPFSTKIFMDSSKQNNSIWVLYGKFLPHLIIDKETASQAVAMIKTQANMIEGVNHTFTEQKLGKLKGFSYIKMKAIEESFSYKRYAAFYLISSNRRTFMIKIFNDEDVDLQEYINETVFRKAS